MHTLATESGSRPGRLTSTIECQPYDRHLVTWRKQTRRLQCVEILAVRAARFVIASAVSKSRKRSVTKDWSKIREDGLADSARDPLV